MLAVMVIIGIPPAAPHVLVVVLAARAAPVLIDDDARPFLIHAAPPGEQGLGVEGNVRKRDFVINGGRRRKSLGGVEIPCPDRPISVLMFDCDDL
jgi:hypothetical protein